MAINNLQHPLQYLMKLSRSKKINLFKRYTLQKKKESLRINFLKNCKLHQVFPNFINNGFKLTINSKPSLKALEIFKTKWLNEEIKNAYWYRDKLCNKIWILHKDLASNLHPAIWDLLDYNNRALIEQVTFKIKIKLDQKLHRLIQHNSSSKQLDKFSNIVPNFQFHEHTINLSDFNSFTKEEIDFLDYGLKYTPTFKPNKKTIMETVAKVEYIINSNDISSNNINHSISNIFKNNINNFAQDKKQLAIYKSIKTKISDNNLILLKADKGTASIIMNKSDYIENTNKFLNENKFKLSDDHNILMRFHSEHNNVLNLCSETLAYFDTNKYKLLPSNPTLPKLYSQPKVHKELSKNCPIRPINSFIGSSAYNTSKFLLSVFNDHLPFESKYSIKNSYEAIERLQKMEGFSQECILVSFDIQNMYPNIPTDECISLVKDLLFASDLPDFVTVDLLSLLKSCLKQNFFSFDNKIYIQGPFLQMGGVLAPLLAQIFISNIEHNVIEKNIVFKKDILLYMRYIDDCAVIFRPNSHDKINMFLNFLNSIHKNLHFTMEKEKDNELAFLDLKLTKINNKIQFSIFRKPSTTSNAIPYFSFCDYKTKFAFFHSMFHRLFSVPLSKEEFENELSNIFYIAQVNKFPKSKIMHLYHKIKMKFSNNNITALIETRDSEPIKYYSLPFLGKISIELRSLFKKYNFSISFSSGSNIKSLLSITKDLTPSYYKSGVYALICATCGDKYVGVTKRQFAVRLDEHFNQIVNKLIDNNKKVTSNYASHILNNNHMYDRDFITLHVSNNYLSETLEKYYIYIENELRSEKLINEQLNFANIRLFKTLFNVVPDLFENS